MGFELEKARIGDKDGRRPVQVLVKYSDGTEEQITSGVVIRPYKKMNSEKVEIESMAVNMPVQILEDTVLMLAHGIIQANKGDIDFENFNVGDEND